MSSLAEDLQVLAFHEVLEETPEYRLKSLYRWYSREFSTPLHQVQTLPLTDILWAFWSTKYEGMSEEELEEERLRLLETEEQRRQRLLREDTEAASNSDFIAQVEAEAGRAPLKIEDLKMSQPQPVKTRERIPEVEMPSPGEKLPEDVRISFLPTNFFNELVDRLDGIEIPGDNPQSS